MNLRGMLFQSLKIGAGCEAEHSGIPLVISRSHIPDRCLFIRFFDKCRDAEPTRIGNSPALAYVAKAGFRVCRMDTKRHQVIPSGKRDCFIHRQAETIFIADQVICRHHQHGCLRTQFTFEVDSCHCNRRGGIATHRLQQEWVGVIFSGDVVVQITRVEIVITAGDREYRIFARQAQCPAKRLFSQGFTIQQFHKWLGVGPPGNRP